MAKSFSELMGEVRAWHYTFVRETAHEALRGILNGELDGREALDRWVDETCDGTERAIYNGQAALTCAASDNSDVYEDENGDKPENDSVRAAWALVADIRERLRAETEYAVVGDPWTSEEVAYLKALDLNADSFPERETEPA